MYQDKVVNKEESLEIYKGLINGEDFYEKFSFDPRDLAEGKINEDESEFERNTPDRIDQFIKELDALIEEYHAELYLKDDVFTGIEAVKMAALGENTSQD